MSHVLARTRLSDFYAVAHDQTANRVLDTAGRLLFGPEPVCLVPFSCELENETHYGTEARPPLTGTPPMGPTSFFRSAVVQGAAKAVAPQGASRGTRSALEVSRAGGHAVAMRASSVSS